MQKKNSDWVVGKNELGQAILEWRFGQQGTHPPETDPLDRTHNFLERLDVSGLSLEDEADGCEAYNPYDTGAHRRRGLASNG